MGQIPPPGAGDAASRSSAPRADARQLEAHRREARRRAARDVVDVLGGISARESQEIAVRSGARRVPVTRPGAAKTPVSCGAQSRRSSTQSLSLSRSHASPMPSASTSAWLGLGTRGQLSSASLVPSPSASKSVAYRPPSPSAPPYHPPHRSCPSPSRRRCVPSGSRSTPVAEQRVAVVRDPENRVRRVLKRMSRPDSTVD